MDKNKGNASKMTLVIGVCGFVAGAFLIFSGATFIGVAGSVASAGLVLKAYKDSKSS
jgi:hypothetical protein